ncbi:MAG: tRNA preQ1(34) S-adenosylmethionine ribosyltransferase-isomerase QueA [Anaerolineae bacterium]|jgi:S-adenosylmethionine:tRNA ribosyltransferase-isomerase
MKTDDFDYELPQELVAQTPVEPRDASRLMVVHRDTGRIEHRVFAQVAEYLRPGDLLVLNQTRVIPARLFGRKAKTGGKVELLLLDRRDERTWEALVRGKHLRPGITVELGGQAEAPPRARAEIVAVTESGGRLLRFDQPIEPLLDDLGVVPLPPYIHHPLDDPERYQTVYGRVEGSVAASTAGLHFTPELLVDLRRAGVKMAFITLQIGLDTFRPVKAERVEDHQIHSEWYEVTAPVAEQVNRARLEGRRVIAVGTTVVRALESAAGGTEACGEEGAACGWRTVSAFAGSTDLFIYPGYRFRAVEAMITNFHLPRSTLLMLVSAFAGRELIQGAYREAVDEGYRFFSFGDAMLLL